MSVSQAPATTTRRRGPWRWLVALFATVALVVSGSGLVVFAANGAGASKSAEWVPAGTPIYAVVRMDGPGGQEEALAQLLTPFPGFNDAASFTLKLDEALDGLFAQMTGGAVSYSGQVKDFFAGEIGIALPNVMEAAVANTDPDVIAGARITDREAAEALVAAIAENAPGDLSSEEYAGATIIGDDEMTLAVTDGWVLLAQSAALIKESLDVLSGALPSLADDPAYAAAATRVPDAHLAAVYMDMTEFGALIETGMAATGQAAGAEMAQQLMGQLPTDMVAYVAVAPDSMTMEAFITPAADTPAMSMRETDLAASFPAGTQLYVEMRDLGAGLEAGLSQLMEVLPAESAEQIAPLEDMLAGMARPDGAFAILNFLGDLSLGVGIGEGSGWIGLVGTILDQDVAETRVDRILSTLGALQMTVEDETVEGVTVSTITLPMDDVAGSAGLPLDIGSTISVAVADGELLLGTGDFVTSSLAQDPASSLALDPGYVEALGDETVNAGVMYAAVGDVITQMGPLLATQVEDWADVEPWVSALDRFIAVNGSADDVISSRMTMYMQGQ